MRHRLRHLPVGLGASGVALVLCAVIGTVVGGPVAGVGAAAGVALAAFSFTLSSVVIAWADVVNPRLILPVGLMTYVVKFGLFGLLLYVVGRSGWDGIKPLGLGVAAGAMAWVTTQAIWVYRSRIHYVDLTTSRTGGGS
jgi:hypothetical protein